MGVHYVKDALVRDGQLDPERPEALLYEMRNGKLFLLAALRRADRDRAASDRR
jgi:hypothetical protein